MRVLLPLTKAPSTNTTQSSDQTAQQSESLANDVSPVTPEDTGSEGRLEQLTEKSTVSPEEHSNSTKLSEKSRTETFATKGQSTPDFSAQEKAASRQPSQPSSPSKASLEPASYKERNTPASHIGGSEDVLQTKLVDDESNSLHPRSRRRKAVEYDSKLPSKKTRVRQQSSDLNPEPESKPASDPLMMTGERGSLGDSEKRCHTYYLESRDPSPPECEESREDVECQKHESDPSQSVAGHGNDQHQRFVAALKKRGLEIVEQEGDGNCLFRAISLQVYGDSSMHTEVRQRCLDHMARDEEHFAQFITDEPFQDYISRKRLDGVHGNNPEIQAISELFNRPVEVFVAENGASPLNIFHAEYKTEDVPIRLSYHDGNHYNAVVDPVVPTAGLGLGMPGLQPGLADKLQMAKAVAESDKLADQLEYDRALKESQNDELQRAIKESSLKADNIYKNKAIALSDLDATNFELEQAVLESSMQTFCHYEQGRKKSSSQAMAEQRQNLLDERDEHATASSLASYPAGSFETSSIPHAAAASASVASLSVSGEAASKVDTIEEYPQSVHELVMNGFERRRVIRAYELIGDNFDDLLSFLMSQTT